MSAVGLDQSFLCEKRVSLDVQVEVCDPPEGLILDPTLDSLIGNTHLKSASLSIPPRVSVAVTKRAKVIRWSDELSRNETPLATLFTLPIVRQREDQLGQGRSLRI